MVGDPDVPLGEYTWPTSLSRVFGLIYSVSQGAQLGARLSSVDRGTTRRTGSDGMAKPRRHAVRQQREGGRGLQARRRSPERPIGGIAAFRLKNVTI